MNLDLCILHLHEITDREEIFSFLVFGDGCAMASRPSLVATTMRFRMAA